MLILVLLGGLIWAYWEASNWDPERAAREAAWAANKAQMKAVAEAQSSRDKEKLLKEKGLGK